MSKVSKIVLLLFLAVTSLAQAAEKPEDFFQKYIKLGDNFDPAVANLYSDKAKIHGYHVYPHGLERAMELTGSQWKQLIPRLMSLAKAQNDKDTFSNITISKQGAGYKIKANRYSEGMCYTDSGYYMVVEPDSNGKLFITEQYIKTQSHSNC